MPHSRACIPAKHLRAARSEAVRRAFNVLCALQGVEGVFIGLRSRRGAWTRRTTISVHVRRKQALSSLPPHRVIPRVVFGLRTDVLEVGRCKLHFLDPSDSCAPLDASGRSPSRMTMLSRASGGPLLALVSGHGTLPLANGRIVTELGVGSQKIELRDGLGGKIAATLIAGRCDHVCDAALARADSAPPARTWHPAARREPPLLTRASLTNGEHVQFFRNEQGPAIVGTVRGRGTKVLSGPGGHPYAYSDVYVIEGKDGRFSRGSDSGSLVTDELHRAVGVVVGGDNRFSYVIPVGCFLPMLGAHARRFFR